LRDGRMLTAAFAQDLTTINLRTFNVQRLAIPADSMKRAVKRSVFIPTDVLQTDDSTLYIGTVSNGLIRLSLRSGHMERIHGLSCSDIGAIIMDREHNLWVSTMNGLNRIDCKTGKVTPFFKTDGTGGNQFNDRAACSLPNGELIFGGTHGVTIFNPERKQTVEKTRLVFEALKVHNQVMNPKKNGCIDSIMEKRPVIRLKHYQNSFSITYAALAYSDYERVNYAYKLDGFDDDWIDAGKRREAYYANLPAGHYTLKVKAHSKGYQGFQAEDEIEVIVCPAPWNSWWAWVVYIAIAVMILGRIKAARSRIVQNNLEMQKAQQEKEHEKKINAMNMSFFSNISHEFRTPLTMIAGPVGMLCDDKTLPSDKRKLLLIIQRSVARMLRLVNQLMDFNKLENDTLKLKVARADIIGQLQLISDVFKVNAKEKDITMRTEGLEDSFLMKLDCDKLDKIVSNLLSNALKFTPKGGHICLSFDVEEGNAVIRVCDSGPGIPPSERENIFKRFYQLNNKQEGIYNWGTGIGLYFSRQLANLHHGSLTADNATDGHGAVFTLTLPTDETIYSPEELAMPDSQQTAFPINEQLPQILDEQAENQDKPTVLVVDDDTEVVNYLQTLLMPYYNVTYKFDADSAYKSICESEPDIILCDVIMPGKDGYELCREVKENLQVCHIPMILVTAKATVENQVEGLNTGADAYITKPFDPKLMLAMIHSLLDNREKLKQLLTHSTQTTDKIEKELSPQDRAFMEQLYHVMEEGLSNAELDVAHLTASLHVSRTKLYYKMKGLTGANPSAFFKTYKLNRAAELIKEGKYTMSEVADMTGFSTPSHFSTSFKKQFGVSPSEYA
jgi:signal transduction histidine kinase/DNA-binding response OmpR family regulator